MAMACVWCMSACGQSGEKQLVSSVESFSKAYFNWQYQRAVPWCTEESRLWLSYMASQVNQADVDLLRSQPQGADVEIGAVEYQEGDSAAVVEVTVSHGVMMDTLGQAGRLVEKARYMVPMTFRQGRWRVHLSAPLRPERE